jgi:DNA modification methylase
MEINKVYCKDTLEFNKQIPDKSVNLIISDSPYFEIVDDYFDHQWKTPEEFLIWFEQNVIDWKRILKDDGNLFIYTSQEMNAEIDIILRKYFIIKNRIIWYRQGGRPMTKKYRISHEHLFSCVNNLNNHTWNPDNVKIKSVYADKDKRLNPDGKVPDDVWVIPNLVGKKKEKVNHSTQKPLAICDRIVLGSSNPNDLVYIPFGGSGSEIVCCVANGRRYIATEMNEKYVEELIKPRVKNIEKITIK